MIHENSNDFNNFSSEKRASEKRDMFFKIKNLNIAVSNKTI